MNKKTKKLPKSVLITGLICITLIQMTAMYFGIDGTFRAICAALIAGILGIALPQIKLK